MNIQDQVIHYTDYISNTKQVMETMAEQYESIKNTTATLFFGYSYYDIANGILGNCLLFNELYLKTGDMKYRSYSHNMLKLGINREGLEAIDSVGLWSGLSGVCYVLEALNQYEDKSYSNIIKQSDQILLKKLEVVLQQAFTNLQNNQVKMTDYDLMEGLTGVAQYILGFKQESEEFAAILNQIIAYFVQLTGTHQFNSSDVPNWHIKSENQFLDGERKQYKNGNFNLGLSHGISGVLLIMVKLYHYKGSEELRQAISTLCNWIYERKLSKDGYYVWEKKMSWEQVYEDRSPAYSEKHLNLSWCYGDLMIMYSLLAAYQLLDDKPKLDSLVNSLERISEAKIVIDLISPTLCHGYAGAVLVITKIQAMLRGSYLASLKSELYEKLVSAYSDNNVFGFKDIEDYLGDRHIMDKYSLLTGSTGIYLLLLLLSSEAASSRWEALFLLD